jgi:hypothetical protein
MLQDVMRGRRTEIDQLNGYVSAPGRRLGLPTPYNDAIVALVTAQPVGRLRPDPARIAPSLEMPGVIRAAPPAAAARRRAARAVP